MCRALSGNALGSSRIKGTPRSGGWRQLIGQLIVLESPARGQRRPRAIVVSVLRRRQNAARAASGARKSTSSGWPYSGDPSQPTRCTSTFIACSPNVGFGPMLIAAGQRVWFGRFKPRPAYTPGPGSSVSMASRLAVPKPSFAPRPAPCTTMPRMRYGSVSNSRACVDASLAEQPADARAGNVFAADHQRLDDFQANAGVGRQLPQHVDRAAAAAAEIEIRPLDHRPRVELLADDAIERTRRASGAAALRRSDRRSPRRRPMPASSSALRSVQVNGGGASAGRSNAHRVRIEREDQRRAAQLAGLLDHALDDPGVPPMHAVEIADRHRARAQGRRASR